MWPIFKRLLSGSKLLNVTAGEIILTTSQESGVSRHSFFEWRVKETIDKSDVFIAVKMLPDSYAGPEGAVKNYINFDVDTAVRLRDSLNDCIEFARKYQEVRKRAPDSKANEIA